MHYIIYDLEATCWPDNQHLEEREIIEIGAVRLDAYGDVVSTFDRFVKPVLHPYLSPFCHKLTSITQHDVNRAGGFERVVGEFRDWGDIYDNEDYLLCSWGDFDRDQVVTDCRLHRIEEDWVYEHINLKEQYKQIKGYNRARGLARSVEREGFEFTGSHHRAIDDAINLAKIFRKYFDEWRF